MRSFSSSLASRVPEFNPRSVESAEVLVTGGTGFTGQWLVQRLLELGANVRCIVRRGSVGEASLPSSVRRYRGSVYDSEVVQRASEGITHVFHLATEYRDAGADTSEHWKVHVLGTKLLAEAALRQAAFQRFLHVSTVGVHGHIEGAPASEDAPFSPGDAYQETKLEGELWIRGYAEDTGLNLTVIRPTPIMGPGDKRLLKLFKFAKLPVCPLFDGHDTLYHFVHVADLADCMIAGAFLEAARGEVFICGNSIPASFMSIVSQVGDLLGRRVRYISVPSAPLFAAARINEKLSNVLGMNPILYERRVAFFTKDRSFNTAKVQRVLGYRYLFSNETAIADTVSGYRDVGWL